MELKLKFEGFEGSITMRIATNIERFEVMDELSLDVLSMASSNQDEEARKSATDNLMNMKNIVKLLKLSKDYYVKVAIKKGNVSFKSFDDLNNDPECQSILMECATKSLLGLGVDTEKK